MDDWRTYDGVAEIYERVHAPRFVEVARDLVTRASIGEADRVLDVGSGTGVAAEAAAGAGATVVGIDESMGMLHVSRRERPTVPAVASVAIDLPFGPATFDAVLGTFVLAHFTKYDTALFELRRVLKTGGRIGFSSWHDGIDAYQEVWRELIEGVVPRDLLAPAYAEAAPWHDRFRSRDSVEETLIDAGFRQVRTRGREVPLGLHVGRLPGRAQRLGDRPVRSRDAGRSRLGGIPHAGPRHVRATVPRPPQRLPRGDPGHGGQGLRDALPGRGSSS